MKKSIPFWLVSSIFFYAASPVTAQIVPDSTLPVNSSITVDGDTSIINGGTQADSNLFHSFEQFSVPPGGTAYFNNALDIQNIFSRVIGRAISNIDGLLQSNGTANLFLLNPNGIIFGSNARLNIGGSFLASTASSLNFADNTQFSATSLQTTPLLTVSVPVGLGFGSNSGQILVQGLGAVRDSNPNSGLLLNREAGLSVQPSKTLALIGNGVVLEGGILTTDGGRIELGSVAGSSLVNLTPIDKGWALGYTGIQNFEDIQLLQQAAIDASGVGGGDIQVQGRQLTLSDGSQIENSTTGSRSGGTLKIITSDLVELIGTSGFPTALATTVVRGATGNGGNLTLETGRLSVRDGAQIGSATFGQGSAGTLTVEAKESVELVGTTADGRFPTILATSVQRRATGNGGNLTLETGRLSVQDGAQIGSATAGTGSAGTLTVKAKELVELIGTTANGQRPSALSARTTGVGDAGNLTVETRQLHLQDGARVTVSSEGSGRSGQLEVKAGFIYLDNQAKIVAETFSSEGGNIALQVQDSLQMRRDSQISAEARGTANGGNIGIETGTLVPLENSDITANAVQGQGGNIQIRTQGLFFSSDSNITASSQLGIDGLVEINTLGFDARNTLTPLISSFVSIEQVVAGSCLARRNAQQGSFIVTGSGGLPTTPYSGTAEWDSLTGVKPDTRNNLSEARSQQQSSQIPSEDAEENYTTNWKPGDPIVEAQAIVKTADGRTLLGMKPQKDTVANPETLVCSAVSPQS